MSTTAPQLKTPRTATHFDVLIIGAGISGIGAAYHVRTQLPGKTFAILEARGALGGTWDLFRYPGIRSDSDLHTFAYEFKPWTRENAIADADEILDYLHETVEENDLARHIRFGHKVLGASWSSERALWTVLAKDTATGERVELTCGLLFSAAGYYDYDAGYTPPFEGRERFGGTIVHPQRWPEDLDYRGKRVVVIGSGATAVTLIPAMAEQAGHVTMLQRSPSYVMTLPAKDPIANGLRRILPDMLAYRVTRRMNIARQRLVYNLSMRYPRVVRRLIRALTKHQLPDGYAIDTHFKPRYSPWEERLCAVPDGDLFKAISDGSASVVTDQIVRFTERGILLESGRELEADVIVTATGLNLLAFGGMNLDGRRRGSGPRPDDGLQEHDALRDSELRLRRRLHEFLMDAQGRSRLRPSVPDARADGRARIRHGRGRRRRPDGRAATAARPPRRLRAACGRSVPEAGLARTVDGGDELPGRPSPSAQGSGGGSSPPVQSRRVEDAIGRGVSAATLDLTGKTAVVTGAGSGIGRATALLLARHGARVHVTDVNAEAAAAVADEIGASAVAHTVDVSVPEQVQALADSVFESDGAVDILHNNAGIGHAGEIEATTIEDWQRVIAVNLLGVAYGVQVFVPRMLTQGRPATIVNTASEAGLVPTAKMAPYCTSKFGVVGMSESLDAELCDTRHPRDRRLPGDHQHGDRQHRRDARPDRRAPAQRGVLLRQVRRVAGHRRRRHPRRDREAEADRARPALTCPRALPPAPALTATDATAVEASDPAHESPMTGTALRRRISIARTLA